MSARGFAARITKTVCCHMMRFAHHVATHEKLLRTPQA